MIKSEFLRGWRAFTVAFKHTGRLEKDDAEVYFEVLSDAQIPPDVWAAVAKDYTSRASTYDRPPTPDEVIEDCKIFEEKQKLKSRPQFCPLCRGRRIFPVHILYLTIARPYGIFEVRRFTLPISLDWSRILDWLNGISPNQVVSWHLGLHDMVPCDCRRGLGRYKTYSDLIPNRPPRADDWSNECTSRERLYAALQAMWPGREQYYVPPLAKEDENNKTSNERRE